MTVFFIILLRTNHKATFMIYSGPTKKVAFIILPPDYVLKLVKDTLGDFSRMNCRNNLKENIRQDFNIE
jgi:hypothetical protein